MGVYRVGRMGKCERVCVRQRLCVRVCVCLCLLDHLGVWIPTLEVDKGDEHALAPRCHLALLLPLREVLHLAP